ncbi:DUF3331 domain-containing protein [Undibacterium arcticum]|uniref:DUF3331 domain-containing protein n=1 Tax=Undibacterium arcticum TaxID=1762892 RepID=UPI00361B0961
MIIIQFLEKPSERKLLLSWREPARCNYTEQLWTLRKAPNATTCALSGEKSGAAIMSIAPSGSRSIAANASGPRQSSYPDTRSFIFYIFTIDATEPV